MIGTISGAFSLLNSTSHAQEHVAQTINQDTDRRLRDEEKARKKFSILASTDKNDYRKGEAVIIKLKYTNDSDMPIDILLEKDFKRVRVKREDGNKVSLKPGYYVGSLDMMRIESHSILEESIAIDKTFDMSKMGKYQISVVSFFPNHKNHTDKSKPYVLNDGAVNSNKVTISVKAKA